MWSLKEWRLASKYVARIRAGDKALQQPLLKHVVNGRDHPIRACVRFEDGAVKLTCSGLTDYISLRSGEAAYLEAHTGNVSAPLELTVAVMRLKTG